MSTYAIGDIQGCYEPLMRLLDAIQFDESTDHLWLVGDLVNRGPQSLEVLRFLKALKTPAIITLGNHDLHLLGRLFTKNHWQGADDTLDAVLKADDGVELGHWLRKQKILYHSPQHRMCMSHAGIAPCWDLNVALAMAQELESCLAGDDFIFYLENMYGNEPHHWSDSHQGMARLRIITNYFTRMRLCDASGALLLDFKGRLEATPEGFYPWFSVPERQSVDSEIIFGHWAALQGHCPIEGIHAIDTGCHWGGALSALCLESRQRISVPNRSPDF